MFLLNIGTAASHVSRCQSVEDKLKKFGGGGIMFMRIFEEKSD